MNTNIETRHATEMKEGDGADVKRLMPEYITGSGLIVTFNQ